MLKFIRGKGQQPSAERQKLQRELFAFRKTVHHGFPNKPTALAWDPQLRLLAIATASGALKVYGKPGVEFYGQHHTDGPVTRIQFLPNQGRLVTLCDDNSLHLWEINDGRLEEVKSQVFEGKLKKISAMCLQSNGYLLLLGTEGGNVYFLNLRTFQMLDTIVYLDVVMQNVSATYKMTNPGAVEAIAEQPGHANHFLIGYTRGLMVLWDTDNPGTKQTFVNPQQLESLCWDAAGKRFASSHNDGSYAFWDVDVEAKPVEEPTTLYGPFPCKPVTKLLWRQTSGDDLMIFSGGMPRASYSDKYTVTVYGGGGKTHSVLDLTSKVVDFTYIDGDGDDADSGILLILAEEELVAVDLASEDMKMVAAPYLASLHSSAVTCSFHTSNVTEELFKSLKEAGLRQTKDMYSDREWPTLGGTTLSEETASINKQNELLLTGHEDGTVRFWDCKGTALTPLYKFTSAPLFNNDDPPSPTDDEEEWPPFKKIGTFDPYSDDPRLAVKKIWLCPSSGTLVVSGTAGHTVVVTLGDQPLDHQIPVRVMNIVSDRDNFVWKGHEALSPSKALSLVQPPGLQVSSVLQLHPPAAVTALSCSTQLGLLVVGTAHGLALYDYIRAKPVLVKCTLNQNDLSAAGDAPISRRKSFKKSLRESFRRLRRGRSTRAGGGVPEKRGAQSPGGGGAAVSPVTSPVEPKPVERQIEARPVDDSLGSMVRCVHISVTFLVSLHAATPTFWAGTNNGTVYAFTITMPSPSKRKEVDVHSQLGKEIQLKHRAPVLCISVVDSSGLPVDWAGTQPSVPHRILICSEEQFKMFTLPSLKPLCKLKLTAHEGCRVRRVGFARFSTADLRTTDTCLVCLTNLGDCLVLNVPELRRQLNAAVIPPEDINGITSLTFTGDGEAFYLHSSSELQRITLSATKVTIVKCRLDLPDSARSKPAENGVDEEGETEEDDEEVSSEDEEEEAEEKKKLKEQEEETREENMKVVEKEAALNDEAPPPQQALTNGTAGRPVENGVEEHETSILSSGDITVDSVKDHLINNHSLSESTVEETKTSVVVKTTTTTIVSEQTVTSPPKKFVLRSQHSPNCTPSQHAEYPVPDLGLDCLDQLDHLDHLDQLDQLLLGVEPLLQISVDGTAPLAKMEDLEG